MLIALATIEKNVTLNGVSVLDKILNIDIISDGTFLTNIFTGSSIGQYFSNMTGYKFNFISGVYDNKVLRHTKLSEWLLANLPIQI